MAYFSEMVRKTIRLKKQPKRGCFGGSAGAARARDKEDLWTELSKEVWMAASPFGEEIWAHMIVDDSVEDYYCDADGVDDVWDTCLAGPDIFVLGSFWRRYEVGDFDVELARFMEGLSQLVFVPGSMLEGFYLRRNRTLISYYE